MPAAGQGCQAVDQSMSEMDWQQIQSALKRGCADVLNVQSNAAWSAPCDRTTPFGVPLVPDVNRITAASLGQRFAPRSRRSLVLALLLPVALWFQADGLQRWKRLGLASRLRSISWRRIAAHPPARHIANRSIKLSNSSFCAITTFREVPDSNDPKVAARFEISASSAALSIDFLDTRLVSVPEKQDWST